MKKLNSAKKQNQTKKIGIIFSVILLAFVLIYIFSGYFLNGIIKPKLVESVNENNKNLNLSVEDLHYNLFSNTFNLGKNKLVYIDSSSNSIDSFLIKVPSIKIDGINWLSYIFYDKVNVSKIIVNEPLINIFGTNNKNDSSYSKKSFSLTSAKILPFNCGELTINSGRFIRINSDHQTIDSIKNFNIQIDKITIDSSKNKNSNLFKNISVKLEGVYKLFTKDGYKLKISTLSLSSFNSSIKIDSINFKPFISEKEFFNRKKFRVDRYIIDIKNFNVNGINISKLINNRDVISDEIKIENFYLNILTPKDKPIKPDYSPKMPNDIFKSLKEKINIKKLLLSNGKLVIESAYKYSNEPAKLPFTNVEAEIKNINNLKSIQTKKTPCEIFAAANLADAGRLSVNMELPLLSKDFSLNYSGTLTSMEAMQLNSQLMIADLVKITSGKVDSIKFDVNVDNGLSSTKVKAIYQNLKIKNLKEESLNGKVEKSTIKTFLANTFVIRKSNPKDGEEKIGRYIFYKKNDDAFMDIIWGNVKGALGDIIGF